MVCKFSSDDAERVLKYLRTRECVEKLDRKRRELYELQQDLLESQQEKMAQQNLILQREVIKKDMASLKLSISESEAKISQLVKWETRTSADGRVTQICLPDEGARAMLRQKISEMKNALKVQENELANIDWHIEKIEELITERRKKGEELESTILALEKQSEEVNNTFNSLETTVENAIAKAQAIYKVKYVENKSLAEKIRLL